MIAPPRVLWAVPLPACHAAVGLALNRRMPSLATLRHLCPARKLLLLPILLPVFAAAGCRYVGTYVETRDEVQLSYAADASTTVFESAGSIGEYRFTRFEGKAKTVLRGGKKFGLEAKAPKSTRAIVQPLGQIEVTLRNRGAGRATLSWVQRVSREKGEFGAESDVHLITGTWADYIAGKDIVLKFEEESWQAWATMTRDRFLIHVDELAKGARLNADQWVSQAEMLDFLVDEKPLVRANRRQLLVFLEPIRLEATFQVVTKRKDPDRSWWLGDYELRPGVARFFAEFSAVTVELAFRTLVACGRCACR